MSFRKVRNLLLLCLWSLFLDGSGGGGRNEGMKLQASLEHNKGSKKKNTLFANIHRRSAIESDAPLRL